jgi:hypothetical protein
MGGCAMQTCIIWVAVLVLVAACCFCSFQLLEVDYLDLWTKIPDSIAEVLILPLVFFYICCNGVIELLSFYGLFAIVIRKRSPWYEGGWE